MLFISKDIIKLAKMHFLMMSKGLGYKIKIKEMIWIRWSQICQFVKIFQIIHAEWDFEKIDII